MNRLRRLSGAQVNEADLGEGQHHADLISGLLVEPQCGLGQRMALIGITEKVPVLREVSLPMQVPQIDIGYAKFEVI